MSPLGRATKRSAGQILISPRVLTAVEDAVTAEPVGGVLATGLGCE
jgi:hypothetical protein